MTAMGEIRRWSRRWLEPVGSPPVGTVAFNQKPAVGSWGGSNQFVVQMVEVLRRRGYRVCFELAGKVDVIVLVDPRYGTVKPFGVPEIAEYKARDSEVKVLHRINECDKRKDTDVIDAQLEEANDLADFTVFISSWLRDYHADRWFQVEKPHTVVYNGADPAVFYPARNVNRKGDVLRLVTHHWSPHWLKGFDVYQELDRMIADDEIRDVELTIVGRWPESIAWKAARTEPPMQGVRLADELRRHDAYITASRWEPCGMHHVEGIQCGLPLLYHEDGGGIMEAGRRCGISFGDDIGRAIQELREHYVDLRRRSLVAGFSGDRMTMECADIVHALMFADPEAACVAV